MTLNIINLKQYNQLQYTESQCCSKDTNEIPDDKFEGDILHLLTSLAIPETPSIEVTFFRKWLKHVLC